MHFTGQNLFIYLSLQTSVNLKLNTLKLKSQLYKLFKGQTVTHLFYVNYKTNIELNYML